ncbi:MAG TPA: lysine biosynthesis protein LysW [Caldilineae bacterium]|jgi:alpha-aminoadipate carrier protein LysW|nr:lysine biosynthesis protein LysW [Caldilineae bacterium]
MAEVKTAECPECAAEIELSDVIVGEIIECPDCGVELEVRNLDPLELDLAPQEEEDWGE